MFVETLINKIMKKVAVVLGSPKKHGNTAQTIDFLKENLLSHGNEVDIISLRDYNINHCIGCLACTQRNDGPGCIQKDDANALFERMIATDIIVFATPIYCYDFCSLFKTFIDRSFSLTHNCGTPNGSSCIAGKDTYLLVTCGGTTEENATVAFSLFDRMMTDVMKANVIGKYAVPNSFSSDFTERAKVVAGQMAESIEA
jgi:multimeric flavodoxin WrbA